MADACNIKAPQNRLAMLSQVMAAMEKTACIIEVVKTRKRLAMLFHVRNENFDVNHNAKCSIPKTSREIASRCQMFESKMKRKETIINISSFPDEPRKHRMPSPYHAQLSSLRCTSYYRYCLDLA